MRLEATEAKGVTALTSGATHVAAPMIGGDGALDYSWLPARRRADPAGPQGPGQPAVRARHGAGVRTSLPPVGQPVGRGRHGDRHRAGSTRLRHTHMLLTRTHSLTHTRTHSRTHALTHSRTHSLTHARTHTHTHTTASWFLNVTSSRCVKVRHRET